MTSPQRWLVARTKPNRERWAAENVLRQGREPYLPMIGSVSKTKSGVTLAVARPLFASYLFVQTDDQWKFLLGTFGIVGVILVGDKPAVLSSTIIEQLRTRENASGLVVLPKSRFKIGQGVRVTGGAFVNLQGIYDGQADKERQQVLVDYLGRKTKVLIADDQLEAV